MKKLTAGIFATILGVTAMGAASAAVPTGYTSVATTNYVKEAIGAAKTDVSNTYATKDALSTAQTTLQGNIDAVSAVADAAAPQATTYTKTEVDQAIAKVDGATAIAGLEGEIAAIKQEQTTQNNNITNLQNDKANKSDLGTAAAANVGDFASAAQGATADSTAATIATYGNIVTHNVAEFATAAQGATADSTAATVATYGDIVTHDASEFATAAQGALADTAVQPAAINDMATQTWVEGKGYLTEHQSLAEYAKTADVVTNDEFTTFESTNNTAIADAKKAGTDAAAAADAKAVAAQTAAATADAKAVAADGKAVAAQAAADKAQGEVDALETVVAGKADASVLGNYVLWEDVDNSYVNDPAI